MPSRGLEREFHARVAPRELRLQATQAEARITKVVHGHRQFAPRWQQRPGHGEHHGRTLELEAFEFQSRVVRILGTAQFSLHTLHIEARSSDAVFHETADGKITAVDDEVMNAIGIDAQLCTHGKRARADLVERFGQSTLDTRQIAGKRDAPAVVAA